MFVDLVVGVYVDYYGLFCSVRDCDDAGVGTVGGEGPSVWKGWWWICAGCECYCC